MVAEVRADMVVIYVIGNMTMARTIFCRFGSHGSDFNTLVVGGAYFDRAISSCYSVNRLSPDPGGLFCEIKHNSELCQRDGVIHSSASDVKPNPKTKSPPFLHHFFLFPFSFLLPLDESAGIMHRR